jgi:hypothetical protein
MSDFKTICSFSGPWYVKSILADRPCNGCKLTLHLTLSDGHDLNNIKLIHPDNEDILTSLLDVERLVISKELNSQREFGTIHIECFSESYSEYWCDSVELS